MSQPTFTAFAGIRTTLPPERLGLAQRQAGGADQRTDLTAAVNIDLDDTGRASRRAGQTRVVAGAVHSLWSDDEWCLYVQDGALRRLHRDYSSTTLVTGLGGAPLCYVRVNNVVYWSDGSRTGAVVGNAATSWGLAVPPAQPAATVIPGTLAAGVYQYALTWLAEDGQESGTGPAARIDLGAGSGLRFAWPAPLDPRIARAALYVTAPNGSVPYLALVTDARLGTADWRGGDLALPLATQWLDAPPPGQDLTWHRGRIWIAAGAHLFATSALGYGYCDLRDYLALDGSRIRFVAALQHGLFAGTARAVYYLAGDAFESLTMNTVIDGAAVPGSAVVVDGHAVTLDPALAGVQCLLFACARGVCLGKPDGSVVNLTYDRYQSNMSLIGAAVLRSEEKLTQYLLAMHD